MQAEAINQIIHAKTDVHRKNAFNSYLGNNEYKIETLKNTIIDVYSQLESRIEFADEDDIISEEEDSIKRQLLNILSTLEKELRIHELVSKTETGTSAVIAGPVNAGKSSLMNILLGYERSIVDSIAGTTRDYVSEQILISGRPLTIIDTAGLHKTEDLIEQKGIDRSLSIIKDADFVIWVTPADQPLEQEEFLFSQTENILALINKSDKGSGSEKTEFCRQHAIPYLVCSIIDLNEKETIVNFISRCISETIDLSETESFIINERQASIIQAVKKTIEEMVEENTPDEIMALHLQTILGMFESFFGTVSPEEIMNHVFESFCIGK